MSTFFSNGTIDDVEKFVEFVGRELFLGVGAEKPGVLDQDGKIRDLSDVVGDIDISTVTEEELAKTIWNNL